MTPDSAEILLLAIAFPLSVVAYHQMIARPNASTFGYPFAGGLTAMLAVCGFLLQIVIAPAWHPYKPVFLGIGVILLGPAVALFRQFRPQAIG